MLQPLAPPKAEQATFGGPSPLSLPFAQPFSLHKVFRVFNQTQRFKTSAQNQLLVLLLIFSL